MRSYDDSSDINKIATTNGKKIIDRSLFVNSMLEVVSSSTLRSPSCKLDVGFTDDFSMVVDDNLLLDYIDFTSCDVVPSFFDADGDILPDLEVDPTELLAEFDGDHHHDGGGGGAAATTETKPPDDVAAASSQGRQHTKEESLPPFGGGGQEEERKRLLEEKEQDQKNGGGDREVSSAVTTEYDDNSAAVAAESSSVSVAEGRSKKTKPSKNSHHGNGNKRKVKVDWTPELHRKFVQAVEQLGIDKAVPSRILEIMGIECLTRHNIASHLQKYRSHRKHLLAREAEAASWAQKRQLYAAAAGTQTQLVAGGGAPSSNNYKQQDMRARPWVVPTIGFPPPSPPFGRPLHVWGHPPTAAAPMLPVWPRHLSPPPRPPWAPVDPAAYWHQQYNAVRTWDPRAVTQHQFPPAAVPPAPAMMMYRPQKMMPHAPPHLLQMEAHPSKESIDAAIGDVLVKPWLPLPLGLKPPSLDSVMSELHKQGISNIPSLLASSRCHNSPTSKTNSISVCVDSLS